MAGIHDMLEDSGLKVGRFVHDEQQQFGHFMTKWYDVSRRFTVPTHATARIIDLQEIDTYDCKIEILPSRDVVGLQVVDAVLWLYRRSISDGMKKFPRCASLVELVHERAGFREHSKRQLGLDAERAYGDIMRAPLDKVALDEGRQVTKEIERARKSRMWNPD